MSKISVTEFLNDKSLLEVNYIPYDAKVFLVDSILTPFPKNQINSALLKRVSTQIFIETITNLDMNIKNENELNGYDLLCLNNELDNLIEMIRPEYSRLEDILKCKLDDIYRYDSNMIKILFDQVFDYLNDTISTIDVQKITDIIKSKIDGNFKEVE